MESTKRRLSTRPGAILSGLVILLSLETYALAATLFQQNSAGPTSEGFQLSAELTQPTIVAGEPVYLRLVCRNTTMVPLGLSVTDPLVSYTLSIEDSAYDQVPARCEVCVKDVSAAGVLSIPPGGEYVAVYPISRDYDLSAPGEYRIVASRHVFSLDGGGFGELVSGSVILLVSDRAGVQAHSLVPPRGVSITSSTGAIRGQVSLPGMVAVRPVLQSHGCSLVWDPDKRKATILAKGVGAAFEVGSDVLVVGGRRVKMWRAAKVVNGQLQAPGDAVSQITALCTAGT